MALVWVSPVRRAGFPMIPPACPRLTPEMKQLAASQLPAIAGGCGVVQIKPVWVGRQVASFFRRRDRCG